MYKVLRTDTADAMIRRTVLYVAERFGGSLPAFINAFTAGRRLTREEAEGLKQMIEAYEEEES